MHNSNQQGRARLDRQARQPRPYSTGNRASTSQPNQHTQQQPPQQTGMQASMPLLDSLFAMDDPATESVIEELKMPAQVMLPSRPAPTTSRNSTHAQLIPARPQPPRQAPRNGHRDIGVMQQQQQQQQQPANNGLAGNRRYPPPPSSMAVVTIASNAIQQSANGTNQYQRNVGNRTQPCASMAVNPSSLRPHDNNSHALVPVQPQQLVHVGGPRGGSDANINYPPYHVVFHDLIKEHTNVAFSLPKHFYDYFSVPSQVNTTKVLLFKYNQRALAMEVEMGIFGEFVCRLLYYLVTIWRVQYHVEVQDAPPDWIARYKKGAVVNNWNYDRLAKRIAAAINCCDAPPVIDEKLPEPFNIYITAQRNHLLIVLTWGASGDRKDRHAIQNTTISTQTDFLVLPSYYMDMLRDQIAAMTISEISSDEGFFEHQEVINAVETAQKNICGHMQEICEKFDSTLKLQKEFMTENDANDETIRQYSTSKEVQTEDNLVVEGETIQTIELPPADAVFDTYADFLYKIIQYSYIRYKKLITILQERETEYKQLKYDLSKKTSHSHRDPKKSDKYDTKHRDEKKVYPRKDEKRSPSRSSSSKENKENKDVKDDRRRSESRSRTSSSRKRSDSSRSKSEKIGGSINEDFLEPVAYLDGIKAILMEHNIANNVPADPVKQEPVVEDPIKDEAMTADAFEMYLNEINAEPVNFEVPNGVMGQDYTAQNTGYNILSDYNMCM